MTNLPAITKPADLALHLGVSERALRVKARTIGACCELGKTMWFTDSRVALIMEATQCPSNSSGAAKSGTSQEQLPEGDFAALAALRTKPSPNESRTKLRRKPGVVISMDRKRT